MAFKLFLKSVRNWEKQQKQKFRVGMTFPEMHKNHKYFFKSSIKSSFKIILNHFDPLLLIDPQMTFKRLENDSNFRQNELC